MKLLRFLAGGTLLLLISACSNVSGSYGKLKAKAPGAGDFSQSLAAEYLGYAESQHELGNNYYADYYAAKGLRALESGNVTPDSPTDDALGEANKLLNNVLTDKVKRVAPQQAARTQLLYDCWNHQQSYVSKDERAPCASEFDALAEELEELSERFTHETKRKYTFQFAGDNAYLSDAMQDTLDVVARRTRSNSSYRLELNSMPFARGKSHAETAQIRAEVIRHALIERKVDAWRIEIQDNATAKTVYLSHDKKEQPKNSVLLRIKMLATETSR